MISHLPAHVLLTVFEGHFDVLSTFFQLGLRGEEPDLQPDLGGFNMMQQNAIWVNYNNSPSWIVRPFGDHFTNYDFSEGEQWGRDEIYPDAINMCQPKIIHLEKPWKTPPGRSQSIRIAPRSAGAHRSAEIRSRGLVCMNIYIWIWMSYIYIYTYSKKLSWVLHLG